MTDKQINNADNNQNIDDKQALEEKLANFEKFVARRFDEISMEINATSQLMDMAEDGAEKRFNDMVNALNSINNISDGQSAANSGAELEAAVFETEKAATTILDSCEQISGLIEQTVRAEVSEDVQHVLGDIDRHVNEIFMACSFQDLVGQRIRTALAQLRGVETELTETLTNMGINMPKKKIAELETMLTEPSSTKKHSDNPTTSSPLSSSSSQITQDDIDALFD